LTREKAGHIATNTFNCPQNNNREGEQLLDKFSAALDVCYWDHDIRVIILRGTGEVSFGPGDISIIKTKLGQDPPLGWDAMYEIGNIVEKCTPFLNQST